MSEQSDSEEGMSSINWWLDFFADAGIPPTSAAEYAVSFAEQRIPQEYEIILELGTDEWRELGVTVLGDRLAMKNLAKSGGKTKMAPKKVSKKMKKAVREPEKQSSEEFLSSFISQEKKKAKPLGRQNVEKERVKSKNPFRKSTGEDVDFYHEEIAAPNAVTFTEEMEDEPEVQFKVTLDKQFAGSRKRQSDPVKMSSEPKITRTIGSHPVVQEDTVSSTSKVNVTFNGLTGFGKQPKISCSSFKPSPEKKKSKPETVRSRLGKKNVKNRLGL